MTELLCHRMAKLNHDDLKEHGIKREVSKKHGIWQEDSNEHGIKCEVSKKHGIWQEDSNEHGIWQEDSKERGIKQEDSNEHGIKREGKIRDHNNQGIIQNRIKHSMTSRNQLINNRMIYIIMFLFLAVQAFMLQQPVQAAAAQNVSSIGQMEQVFKQAIKKGKDKITFESSDSYTSAQIQYGMQNAAKSQSRLLMGSMQIVRRMDSSGKYQYEVSLSDDAFIKVKILKSERAAVKAAAKSLKSGEYTNFYSEVSYYNVFHRLLQQHPEYNYDTSVWKSSNGAYGYKRSTGMTKKQQVQKMKAADSAAVKAVKKCVKSNMSDKQKAEAVHNYIVNHCQYARTQNSFTAYGALVDQTAVCQGYAAAFNLMAAKCGLKSMTVCGVAQGGAHAWTYAKIGGKYRYIDCTWDDTGELGDGIIHTYFNVTADKMRETHSWNEADFPSSHIKYYKYFL